MEKFEEHADKFGVEKFPMQEIKSINLMQTPKIIKTLDATFKAKAVIIACGAKPKKLNIKGEEEFIGRGVSYCAVCDGAFYQDKIVQERAKKNKKLEFIFDTVVEEIIGNDVVNKLKIKNVKTNETAILEIDGIFPYIGITPNISAINGQVQQDENGFIITDETMKTSIDGVYAVGDVRKTPLRQVITAASDGAIGAVYAEKYIESLEIQHSPYFYTKK